MSDTTQNAPTGESAKTPTPEEAEAEFQKTLQTPISREDAEKAFADIDVQRMRLLVVRQKWQAQATQLNLRLQALDERLTALDLERAVVFRRSLIEPAKAEGADE